MSKVVDSDNQAVDLRQSLTSHLGASHRIIRELARGGMSRVFLAEELALGRQVVIKVPVTDEAAEVNVDRFEREIRVSAQLQHPNIVPVLSAGEFDGHPYYIMPYVEGRSLHESLADRGPVPVREAVPILRDVARGLAAAHSQGLVHRDIKPDNILLSAGSAMVTDFGVAKAISSARTGPVRSSELTGVGISLGTPAYMSPEQAAAEQDIDGRSDLYALGMIAYEMLAGRRPFSAATAQGLVVAHLTETPPHLSQVNPDLPPPLVNLVMSCLEKDREKRPPSAQALVDALESPQTVTGAAPSLTLRPARRRALIAIGLLAAAAAAGVWLSIGSGGTEEAPSLAVLPFVVIGGDTSDAYLADGIAEELTGSLAGIPGLQVAARTSAFSYRNSATPAGEIGQALGVANLLEGSLRRDGDRLRVSVQLVEVATGLTRWSERYQRQMSDVFEVQDEIVAAITGALSDQLVAAPAEGAARTTTDLAAYDAYLRGRHLFHRRGAANLVAAAELFREAVRRDPQYAEAWSGLADVYGLMPLYGAIPADSAIPLGLAAAERALELDSTLASAWTARGNLLHSLWRWGEAEEAYVRAVGLAPNYATARQWYGEHLLMRGELEPAVEQLQIATRIDPLSPVMAASHALALAALGRRAAALERARGAVELDSTLRLLPLVYGTVYLYLGEADSAVPILEGVLGGDPGTVGLGDDLMTIGMLGYAYAKSGHRDRAESLLDRLPETGTGAAPARARISVALGDRAAAIRWLTEAVRRRDPFFHSETMASAIWQPLHEQPEFVDLVTQLGLPLKGVTAPG